MSDIRTKVFHVSRMNCGVSCGSHGIQCFRMEGDKRPSVYGLNPEEVLGEILYQGAKIEVSVRLLRKGSERKSRNPWLRRPR